MNIDVELSYNEDDIPIEAGVARICELLNCIDGIKTHFSCEGHQPDYTGYVTFTCVDQTMLFKVVDYLPSINHLELVVCDRIDNNKASMHIELDFTYLKDRKNQILLYKLKFQANSDELLKKVRRFIELQLEVLVKHLADNNF